MTEQKNRSVEPEFQDYFHAVLTGSAVRLNTTVPEAKVATFCKGCDSLKADGVCRLGANDQGRYAIRGQCGWASEKGVRGEMTDEGFRAFS